MNYFELYKIPISFTPNLPEIKKQFFALSRQYHPDFFGSADEAKKKEALEISAQVNKAYKLFQSQDEIIKYVLQLHHLIEEEEKYVLPPQFLMEVMELNEAVMELDKNNLKEKTTIQQSLIQFQQEIYAPIEKIIRHYQEGITTQEELLQVKAYYYKKKYLDKISQGLHE